MKEEGEEEEEVGRKGTKGRQLIVGRIRASKMDGVKSGPSPPSVSTAAVINLSVLHLRSPVHLGGTRGDTGTSPFKLTAPPGSSPRSLAEQPVTGLSSELMAA